MKLDKELPPKYFWLSQLLILVVGLISLGGFYYFLNIQYQKPKNLFLNGPVTTLPKSLRLDLDQPDDDSLTFQSSIIISGETAPLANVLISTDTFDTVIPSKPDGS